MNCYERGFKDGFDADRWIPVSDGLPKEYENVLVVDEKNLIYISYYFHGFLPGGPSVTHWMPLPEPPKEVQC